MLLIGWNDTNKKNQFDPRCLKIINKFKPIKFKSLDTDRYKVVGTEHVFDLYIKKLNKTD